jgi:hypothetical protein
LYSFQGNTYLRLGESAAAFFRKLYRFATAHTAFAP